MSKFLTGWAIFQLKWRSHSFSDF